LPSIDRVLLEPQLKDIRSGISFNDHFTWFRTASYLSITVWSVHENNMINNSNAKILFIFLYYLKLLKIALPLMQGTIIIKN
jgi:hypothetical protein